MAINVLKTPTSCHAVHALFIPDPSIIGTSLILRARFFAKGMEGRTARPKGDKVSHAARSEQRREAGDEARRRKGSREARVDSFNTCGPSSEYRYGPRAGTITEPTNAGEYGGQSRMLMPTLLDRAQRDPWIGKYLASAEKYREYVTARIGWYSRRLILTRS